ncbi:MAG: M20 family metallopeptidase [Kiritimatiellia bacterium]|nr:M20 family metallopeptidase [Kiritimatiellia bacterium]
MKAKEAVVHLHPVIHNQIINVAHNLRQLAKKIHSFPELGFKEKKACHWQAGLLRKWHFRVETPFAGLITAYHAAFGRGRPALCFMAEYDALPELGHGCGHNLICAAALGAGKALAEIMRQEGIAGTVFVMGTPAEEALGGKVKMIKAGALKGVDAALMAHPSWRTTPDTGSTALQRVKVRFRGKSAHAAAAPELGKNALDAVILLFQGINAWRQQLPEDSRIHGIIKEGGVAPNIIPDNASCFFYLRSSNDNVLEEMISRFKKMVKGAEQMTGTRAELEFSDVAYRSRRPNRFFNEAFINYAGKLGLNPVIPGRAGRGSSDFGNVSRLVPGAHVYFGIAKHEIAAHSVAFRKAAGSEYALRQMLGVAEVLANTGYRFFTDTDFQNNVMRDFHARRNGNQR